MKKEIIEDLITLKMQGKLHLRGSLLILGDINTFIAEEEKLIKHYEKNELNWADFYFRLGNKLHNTDTSFMVLD